MFRATAKQHRRSESKTAHLGFCRWRLPINWFFAPRILLCAIAVLVPRPANATIVTMSWSPVGNPGNAADPSTGYGAVPYSYSIGTYDVTVAQYVAFLNANVPTFNDPLHLYNSDMGPQYASPGEINYNLAGPNGSKYSVIAGDGNLPVANVTWYDAIRFANWMDNAEPVFATDPTATNNATENGAYTLTGYTATPSNANTITRNAGATVFLPSENEWYKAAFYNAATKSYFSYPTSSNTLPSASGPTSAPNAANYDDVVGNLTNVGAYSGTTSPYGAFDMGGDAIQWTEELVNGQERGLNSAAFNETEAWSMSSADFWGGTPIVDDVQIGFRVASITAVPEPATAVLAALACGMALLWSKRFQRCNV